MAEVVAVPNNLIKGWIPRKLVYCLHGGDIWSLGYESQTLVNNLVQE